MLTTTNRTAILRLIRSHFGDYRIDGNEVKTNCPWCITRGRRTEDTQQKLWINLNRGLYHCWRCEAKGSVSTLFPNLATEFTQESISVKTEVKDKLPLEALPSNLVSLESLRSDHLVHEYLAERRTGIEEISQHAKFCPDFTRTYRDNYVHSFGPRIIFPIMQSGRYCGFQGRTIWRNTEPKYVGALGMEKKKLLWNFDQARTCKRIVLVEGVFDAIRIGSEGVAIFGKSISPEQIRLLSLGKFEQVIVWLDRDAQDYCEETARRLALHFASYMLVTDRFKDAGETPKEFISEILSTHSVRVH